MLGSIIVATVVTCAMLIGLGFGGAKQPTPAPIKKPTPKRGTFPAAPPAKKW